MRPEKIIGATFYLFWHDLAAKLLDERAEGSLKFRLCHNLDGSETYPLYNARCSLGRITRISETWVASRSPVWHRGDWFKSVLKNAADKPNPLSRQSACRKVSQFSIPPDLSPCRHDPHSGCRGVAHDHTPFKFHLQSRHRAKPALFAPTYANSSAHLNPPRPLIRNFAPLPFFRGVSRICLPKRKLPRIN